MNAHIKARWVAALRSGFYVQGYERLRGRDMEGKVRYCCLGVLCELAVQDGITKHAHDEVLSTASTTYYTDGDFHSEKSLLPEVVANWAGLNTTSPYVDLGPDSPCITLSCLNDQGVMSFYQIADLIEREL